MKIVRPVKKPLIAILVKRAVFFFLATCLLTVFLYAIGTGQGFMEATQLILLRLSGVLGIFLAIGAIYGGILDLWLVFYSRRRRFIRGAISYMVLAAFGGIIAAASAFILMVARGNIG